MRISAGEASIFRNDGTTELVVEADRDHRIGAVDGVRHLAVHRVRSAGAVVPAHGVIAVLELADQIVGDRVGNAAAGGQAALLVGERIDRETGGGAGVSDVAIRPAAIDEQQYAVDGDAAARNDRGCLLYT